MDKELLKAYFEIETLHSLELPVPEEKNKAIVQMEKKFIKRELVPYIQSMLEPILHNFQGTLSLNLSYDKSSGIKVTTAPVTKAVAESNTLKQNITHNLEDGCYYIKADVVEAYATIKENIVTVLKGSRVRTTSMGSIRNPEKRAAKLRQIAKNCGDFCILEEDLIFNSLSTAAVFCLGRSANGWLEWKDKFGNNIERT